MNFRASCVHYIIYIIDIIEREKGRDRGRYRNTQRGKKKEKQREKKERKREFTLARLTLN